MTNKVHAIIGGFAMAVACGAQCAPVYQIESLGTLVLRFIKTFTFYSSHLEVEVLPLETHRMSIHFVDAFEDSLAQLVQ